MTRGEQTDFRLSERHNKDAEWIKAAMQAGNPFHIKRRTPRVHNAINAMTLLLILTSLGGVLWAGAVLSPLAYLPWAPFALGLLYFAAFILVVHEASHEMLFVGSGKSREPMVHFSHRLGWLVSAFFATHYGKHWKIGHLEHHLRPLEDTDPQGHNTVIGKMLLLRAGGSMFIPGFLLIDRLLLRKKPKLPPVLQTGEPHTSSRGVLLFFATFWIGATALAWNFLGWHVGISLFLGVHVIVGLNFIKGALEHGGAIGREDNPLLRSRSTFFLLRHLLMPLNITLHFEHHLNYRVPWYLLGAYHKALHNVVPKDVADVVWNHHPLRQLSGTG